MDAKFVIKSVDCNVSLTFSDLRKIPAEWEIYNFHVCLAGPAFEAAVEASFERHSFIANSEDITPVPLFMEIAKDWAGWEGTKFWGNSNDSFSINAVTDSMGHIKLNTTLRNHGTLKWELNAELMIEAAQLDLIASSASDFFQIARVVR